MSPRGACVIADGRGRAITFALGALPQPLLDLANNAARFLP